MKEKIVNILLDFVKERQIHISKVILELFADELIKHGFIVPVYCMDCEHRNEDGHCYVNVEGAGYKKTHSNGYCEWGEENG